MDPATLEIYQRHAEVYERNRPPDHEPRAAVLVDRAPDGVAVLDAGAGTGAYVPALARQGGRVVALDRSTAMLARAAGTGADRVCADLADLPLRAGGVGAGWARNSYLHTPHRDLPMLLHELRRVLPVGAPVTCSFIADHDETTLESDDDLPGRTFFCWSTPRLHDVFTGAGFTVEECAPGPSGRAIWVEATRARSLADTVGPGMQVLVVGLNPSEHAADAGVGFVTPGNRFWPAAIAGGLVSRDRDPVHALRAHGVGMTDLVKRATPRAAELTPTEYRSGLERLDRLCRWMHPGVVCVVGLAGWRAAVDRRARPGPQEQPVGGRPVYLMPSTSGLNAGTRPADFVDHLSTAADLATR